MIHLEFQGMCVSWAESLEMLVDRHCEEAQPLPSFVQFKAHQLGLSIGQCVSSVLMPIA